MGYRKPIITEIFATVRLQEHGLTPSRFFELVPRLKERGFDRVEMDGGMDRVPLGDGAHMDLPVRPPRVRCWAQDDARLIQLSNDFMAANHAAGVGGYLGWDAFRQVFESALEGYRSAFGEPQVQFLTLNTMDEMSAPTEAFQLGRYLNCGGNKVPRWFHDSSLPCDLSAGMGIARRNGLNTRYRIAVSQREGEFLIRVESTFEVQLSAGESPHERLAALHAMSNQHFEEIITDHVRNNVMGGKSNG